MADDAPSLLPHEQPTPARTDLWIAAVFFVFGAAAGWQAFLMPRYAEQKGVIYTAPGLVPGIYSIVIILLSIWLAVRAVRQGAMRGGGERAPAVEPKGTSDLRLALAACLGLFFVVVLIGHLPFWLATAIFVAMFTILFEWQANQPAILRARRIGEALLLGLATGVAVTVVFERFFYVRLP
jgi:hypothetical protein